MNTVWVGNLPRDATEAEIVALFEKGCGSVTEVTLKHKLDNTFGFVRFADPLGFERALKQKDCIVLRSNTLKVNFVTSQPIAGLAGRLTTWSNPSGRGRAADRPSGGWDEDQVWWGNADNWQSSGAYGSDHAWRRAGFASGRAAGRGGHQAYGSGGGQPVVWAGGLPQEVSQADVRCLFEEFGDIVAVKVVHKETDTFAFITFDDTRCGDRAVSARNGVEFRGSTIRVQWSRAWTRESAAKPPAQLDEGDDDDDDDDWEGLELRSRTPRRRSPTPPRRPSTSRQPSCSPSRRREPSPQDWRPADEEPSGQQRSASRARQRHRAPEAAAARAGGERNHGFGYGSGRRKAESPDSEESSSSSSSSSSDDDDDADGTQAKAAGNTSKTQRRVQPVETRQAMDRRSRSKSRQALDRRSASGRRRTQPGCVEVAVSQRAAAEEEARPPLRKAAKDAEGPKKGRASARRAAKSPAKSTRAVDKQPNRRPVETALPKGSTKMVGSTMTTSCGNGSDAGAERKSSSHAVRVDNLPGDMSLDELKNTASDFGEVVDVKIWKGEDGGKSARIEFGKKVVIQKVLQKLDRRRVEGWHKRLHAYLEEK